MINIKDLSQARLIIFCITKGKSNGCGDLLINKGFELLLTLI